MIIVTFIKDRLKEYYNIMKSQCFSRGKESNEPTLIFAFIGHISMVYTF